MGTRILLGFALMMVSGAAYAQHAISLEPWKMAAETAHISQASRTICNTLSLGGGDVRTECRTEPLAARAENPKLRGLCLTRYGNRTCY